MICQHKNLHKKFTEASTLLYKFNYIIYSDKLIYIYSVYIYSIYIYIYIYTLPSIHSLETPLAKCGFGRYHHKSLSFFGANTVH